MFPKPKSKSKSVYIKLMMLAGRFFNLVQQLATYGKRNKFLLLFLPSVDI